MTQQKYSVGNEVLIRAKVVEFDESDTDDPYLIQMELDGYRESGWFSENQIYSIAPEFNPGEEIEVTDKDRTTYITVIRNGKKYKLVEIE